MHLVLILGSMVLAKSSYSIIPTGLQGKSGRFLLFLAYCTRQLFIRNTHRFSEISTISWTLILAYTLYFNALINPEIPPFSGILNRFLIRLASIIVNLFHCVTSSSMAFSNPNSLSTAWNQVIDLKEFFRIFHLWLTSF